MGTESSACGRMETRNTQNGGPQWPPCQSWTREDDVISSSRGKWSHESSTSKPSAGIINWLSVLHSAGVEVPALPQVQRHAPRQETWGGGRRGRKDFELPPDSKQEIKVKEETSNLRGYLRRSTSRPLVSRHGFSVP